MNCDWSWENGEKKQHDWPVFVYCFTKHLTVYNRSLMLFAWTCTEMKESVIELVHTIFLFWFGNIRCLNLVLSLLWPRSNICTSCGRYIFLHGNSLMVRECLALVAWLATLVHFFFWFLYFKQSSLKQKLYHPLKWEMLYGRIHCKIMWYFLIFAFMMEVKMELNAMCSM